MPTLDYFFTLMSPFAYLGHDSFLRLARAHHATVHFRPVRMMELFGATGGVPLAQRAAARQQYRLLELQRWREARALPLNLRPKFFPANAEPADRVAAAIALAGGDPAGYMLGIFRALWTADLDIAEAATIEQALRENGHEIEPLRRAAASQAVTHVLDENTRAAIALNLPGVPGYARDGEVFWGQDRLELLGDALANNRPAFSPPLPG